MPAGGAAGGAVLSNAAEVFSEQQTPRTATQVSVERVNGRAGGLIGLAGGAEFLIRAGLGLPGTDVELGDGEGRSDLRERTQSARLRQRVTARDAKK